MPSSDTTIHVAIELSASLWLVAVRLPGSNKRRMHRVAGGDTTALLTVLGGLRRRSRTKANDVEIDCCFEAGRDGFWLHRLLTANGVQTWVVEPTSILVNRRARRAKTDRLDAIGLLRVLASYLDGDLQVCSMVRVPTPEEEDAKRPSCEREHLVQERTRFENRILALLATQGIRERPSLRTWDRDLATLQTGDGRALPLHLRAELDRLRRRLVLTMELIRELDASSRGEFWRRLPTTQRARRSGLCAAFEESARTSRPCWFARCSTGRSATASSSPVMLV